MKDSSQQWPSLGRLPEKMELEAPFIRPCILSLSSPDLIAFSLPTWHFWETAEIKSDFLPWARPNYGSFFKKLRYNRYITLVSGAEGIVYTVKFDICVYSEIITTINLDHIHHYS